MARTQAISLLQAAAQNADLAEIYGIVIDNVRKDTLSNQMKSTLYTGNPAAGSVEFRRFVNATAKDYGTARAANKGDAITAAPVTVNLNVHREIVEECSKFDLDTFGIGSIMARRAANHIDTMATDLDKAFFSAAAGAATAITPAAADEIDQLEESFLMLETVENDYVKGVPRHQMVSVVTPAFYSKVRTKLDSLPQANVDTVAEAFGTYHGVKVYSCLNLPAGPRAITMINGAVALPIVSHQYGEPEKLQLSEDFASALFYHYGVKALTPDLIFKLD